MLQGISLTLAVFALLGGGVPGKGEVAPEYRLEVTVYLCDSRSDGRLVRQPAEVLLRDHEGKTIFRGTSDKDGAITVPVDYRSLNPSYQIEARLDLGLGEYIGGLITPSGRSKSYSVFIPTPVALGGRVSTGN
jgi:hypothetical protein